MIQILMNALKTITLRTGSLGIAILEAAAVLRIVLSPLFHIYYKSTVLADELQPRIDAIYKKAKNNNEAAKKVSKLLISVKYPSLGMISYLFVFCLLGILFCIPLLNGLAAETIGPNMMGIPGVLEDVSISPLRIISVPQNSLAGLAAFLAPVLVFTVTFFHDRTFTLHSAVNRQTIDRCVLIAATALSVLAPLGFSLYWIVVELVGIIHSAIVRSIFHVSIQGQ